MPRDPARIWVLDSWAFTLSALLSGLGAGLFFDEVGKFIFSAVITALFQFGVLLLVLAYQRWYLEDASR